MDPAIGGIMAHITLTKVKDPGNSAWLQAITKDYDVPRNSQVFWGWGLHDDRIAVWVSPNGGGFGVVDMDPDVDEWEFNPGTFDPSAETIELKAGSAL
jgi:hypothetical protein